MNFLKRIIAIWVCKLLIVLGRLMGKKGSSTPGKLALKIYKNLLLDLSKQIKKEIVAVCGTNGKTTTNNLLYEILNKNGFKVVCNRVGANMLEGVTTAFVSHCNLLGKIDADYAVIEMDEASTVLIFDYLKPNKMIITNLFRDQLDRYGEIDITISLLEKALLKVPKMELILNGDDPLCARFGKNTDRKCFYFGIDEDVKIHLNETKEGRFCTFCGNELFYNYYHYSQLGDYSCNFCGFKRPVLDFRAYDVDIKNGLKFKVADRDFNVNYRGFYNIYNILAAYSVVSLLLIDTANINEILSGYAPQIGRMELFFINKPVILNLSKNPAGFNQAISTLLSDERKKDVVIIINDNAQDGKDISWLWDVDFERMNEKGFNFYFVSGIRCEDMHIRLKYANIEQEKIAFEKNIKKCIELALKKDGEVLYVLVNYTALFETQNILKSINNS